MKKSLRGIGLSLCALLMLAGCSNKSDDSVKANIKNGEESILSGLTEGTKNITLQSVYDDLKMQLGNERAADRLVEIIANAILSDAKWQERYDSKIEEKLMDLVKNESYKVDGHFNEELLVKSLKASLYNITCGTTEPVYGPTYKDAGEVVVDKYLLCDYSDYENKVLKMDVLEEIIKEKYVYDKVFADKSNILTTKKTRLVEYVAFDTTNEDSFKFMTDAVERLAKENSEETLETIAKSWEEKLIADIEEAYNQIGTKDDSNGTKLQDFTNGYKYSKEEGLRLKKQAVYNSDYYSRVIVNGDNKSILNTTLVERILSENILDQDAEKTFKINDGYYLVSPLAGGVIDADDIRITDKTNSKYYLVKVEVVNSESSEDLIYDAVKVLAKNASLVSDSVNYYLEQNKNNISVHDEEIYAYLKTQYKDIFVD